jgi:hypothetical protein
MQLQPVYHSTKQHETASLLEIATISNSSCSFYWIACSHTGIKDTPATLVHA